MEQVTIRVKNEVTGDIAKKIVLDEGTTVAEFLKEEFPIFETNSSAYHLDLLPAIDRATVYQTAPDGQPPMDMVLENGDVLMIETSGKAKPEGGGA